jgi:hypothetical protein
VDSENSLQWERMIPGVMTGSPVISSDGRLVVASHNVQGHGLITIISFDDEGRQIAQKSGNTSSYFGPLQSVKRYEGDFIYWGESNADGYADAGKIFSMHLGEPFSINTEFITDSATLTQLSLSVDQKRLLFAGKNASISSWKVSDDKGREWRQQLPASRRNTSFRKYSLQ